MLEFREMSAYMGYITFKDQNEAQTLCRVMVEKRLIACANIHGPHTAIYNWENSVHTDTEVSATLKTTKDRLKAVEEFVVQNHSYTTPCLVFWPIEEGTDNFLDWIYTQTHD